MEGYITVMESIFLLKEENISKAFKALKREFKEKETISGIHDYDIEDCDTLEELLKVCGWEIYQVESDNYNIFFDPECYYNDNEDILSIIAPYIEDGSYIQIQSLDDEFWRWYFRNGKMIEVPGHLEFEEN